ncbi:MAG: hypothetical protein LBS27_05795 [Bifidobacteriaceae bacterium]|nr:hypothetical protein [Bifidobacteriaceae bacterium]
MLLARRLGPQAAIRPSSGFCLPGAVDFDGLHPKSDRVRRLASQIGSSSTFSIGAFCVCAGQRLKRRSGGMQNVELDGQTEPVKLIETFWLEAFCWWLFVVVLAG